MNKIRSIVEQELKNHFTRRSFLFMSFGLPLLTIILISGYVLIKGDAGEKPKDPFSDLPDEPIGYVDHSGLFEYPGMFGKYLINYPDENEAKQDVKKGKLASVYVIPEDYIQTGQIDRYSNQFNVVEFDAAVIESFLLSTLLKNDNPLLLTRLQSPINFLEYQLNQSGEPITEIEGDSFNNFWLVYVFALALMLPTFFSAGQLTRSVIIEKENRMIEIILSSLRPIQILAGKVIGNGTAGLVQFIAWFAAIMVVIKIAGGAIPFIGVVDLPLWIYAIAILYFIGGYSLFAAFASGIGAISSNMREGPQYAIVYTLPATIPLFILPSILESPNAAAPVILSFFPLSSPLGMIERITITSVPGWQIGISLLLLYTSVVFALWLASRLFRVNTLLAGQLVDRKTILQLLMQK
ncbi:MAG: ABC transporter permease [Anaerolineales bacterium]|nr:ABC transporter permease [Anaerolineales bacterium]